MIRANAETWSGLCPTSVPEIVPSSPIVTDCSGGSTIGVKPSPSTM